MLPNPILLLSLLFFYASGVPINSKVTAKVGNAVNIKHPFTTSPAHSKAPESSKQPVKPSESLKPSESVISNAPSENFMTLAPEDARINRIELSFFKSWDHFLKDVYKALHDGTINIKNHHE